jgi:hypothetical protein
MYTSAERRSTWRIGFGLNLTGGESVVELWPELNLPDSDHSSTTLVGLRPLAVPASRKTRRVCSDSITKFLEFAINTVTSKNWFERERIEEDV